MATKPTPHHTNPPPSANQRERLSEALRANLRRRKDQSRERGPEDVAQARPTLIQKNKD